jgi:hypothetical protein
MPQETAREILNKVWAFGVSVQGCFSGKDKNRAVDQALASLAKAIRERKMETLDIGVVRAINSGYNLAIEDIAKWIEGEK